MKMEKALSDIGFVVGLVSGLGLPFWALYLYPSDAMATFAVYAMCILPFLLGAIFGAGVSALFRLAKKWTQKDPIR